MWICESHISLSHKHRNAENTDVNDYLSSDAETIIYEEPIIKRRNPKRKDDPMQRFGTKKFMKNVGDSYDVQFIKQVPMHPRDRLERGTKNAHRDDDDVEFIKQVPMHPRDRLERATKNAQKDNDDVEFIWDEKELKIARENVSALMRGKFVFDPEVFLNKTVLFDTSKVSEEKIVHKILESLPADNNYIYWIHERGTNSFSLKREDGT